MIRRVTDAIMSETKQNREQLLFEAVVQKTDPAERTAFLAAVCGEDAALRARLEVLVAAHEQSDPLLATPAQAVRPTAKIEMADEPAGRSHRPAHWALQVAGEDR